jgi:hypothetical protein
MPAGDLPAGQPWADADGRRAFAPSFYADLFHHLGVAAVLRLHPDADCDPAAFLAAGIPVADVAPAPAAPADPAAPPGGGGGPSLAELDRLVRLMDSATGLVAIPVPPADARACALIAACIACRPPAPLTRAHKSPDTGPGRTGNRLRHGDRDSEPAKRQRGWRRASSPAPPPPCRRLRLPPQPPVAPRPAPALLCAGPRPSPPISA